MGFYINCDDERVFHKGDWLVEKHGAIKITIDEAKKLVESNDNDFAVICIVDNGFFEAAAYCYNIREFIEFSNERDLREKTWYAMDKKIAQQLSNYR